MFTALAYRTSLVKLGDLVYRMDLNYEILIRSPHTWVGICVGIRSLQVRDISSLENVGHGQI